jgi:hypothetical protein
MELNFHRGTGGRRLGRQLASELLLHRKQRRRCTSAGAGSGGGLRRRHAGEAHERRWRDTGGAWAKLRSDASGARAVAAAAGLAAAARVDQSKSV